MATQAIVADNLTYRYGELTAVDHISFHVDAGEVLGFLGPNGAGKTTTIKMLTGQLRPQEGKATLLGQDITKHAKDIQAHIGVCFELTNLYEQMSAVENLALFARLFGIKGFEAEPLLARVGLNGRGQDRVETYSKGMKQRLMIARALINAPEIIFADEPSGNLDSQNAHELHEIFFKLRQELNQTFVIVTHNAELAGMADRKLVMKDGHIVA